MRPVDVEWSDGRVTHESLRFVVVHSSQLAHQQALTYIAAQSKEAQALAEHVKRVEARWFACEADAAAAIVEYEHRGPGRRGRRPQAWRYHAVRYRVVADTRRTRRARRGRPAKTDPSPIEAGYRLGVEVETLDKPEEENGWTVLATTVSAEVCTDTELLQAYQEQHTTVEPGFRWIKNPAAIAPVWLEKPERIAALAMLTVLGLLVYSVIQRQVRLYLQTHDQQLPGNKGPTALPTATVVFTLFAPVMMVHVHRGKRVVPQMYGVQAYHFMVCDALGLDHAWYTAPLAQKNAKRARNP
jgi:transposase